MPSAPRFLRLHVEVHGEPPLSEGEVAVLEAEEARQMTEAKPGEMVVSMWSREKATGLGAPSPPAEETGIQVEIEVQDAGPGPGCCPLSASLGGSEPTRPPGARSISRPRR
jgi:hypothetical protein